jgi:hypothetical protein
MAASEEGRLVVEANGSISVEGTSLVARLQASAGHWRWLEVNDQLAMLTRSSDVAKRARLLMGGEIIAGGTMLEVLGLLSLNGWHGELGVHARERVRRLRIAERALCAANSNVPSERLAVVMHDLGLLNQAQLEHCRAGGDHDHRIGELALAHGYLSAEQLVHALAVQMRRIFQHAVNEHEGHYALMQGSDDRALATGFLQHIPLQELLLDSVQRIDEMALFRERVPSPELCPVPSARADAVTMASSQRRVFALADGEHSILDIARSLHIEEFEATKQVCQLVQLGALELRAPCSLDVEQAQIMIARFNRVLKRIVASVRRNGDDRALLRALQHEIERTPLARYFAEALGGSGALEPEPVLQRLAALADAPPLEFLERALQELGTVALSLAVSLVPREAERPLSQFVRRSLARLRRDDD